MRDSADECISLISITYRKYMPWHFGKSTAITYLLKSSRRTGMTEIKCHDWKQLAEAARDEEDPPEADGFNPTTESRAGRAYEEVVSVFE